MHWYEKDILEDTHIVCVVCVLRAENCVVHEVVRTVSGLSHQISTVGECGQRHRSGL